MRSPLRSVLRAADRLATALDPLPDYPANIFPLRRPSAPPDALIELDFGTTAPSPHALTLLAATAAARATPAQTTAPAIPLTRPCLA